jgi:tyrosyl-tRNA synthetase
MYGEENKACGLTINLLTKEDGTKFGKSEKGAIYLDPKYTSPFAMYQFLINQPDSKVEQLLKFLTFLTQEEIETILKQQASEPSKRIAQRKLAECIVSDIHGNQVYADCVTIADVLYKGNLDTLSTDNLLMWLTTLPAYEASQDSYVISDLLVNAGVTKSKSDVVV